MSFDSFTGLLLRGGLAAGPVYVLVGLVQVLTREGFDVRRHALSLLSNGDLGWIQIANFLVSGVLVLAGAWGVRRTLTTGRGGTWGPLLLGLYGAGLIGAGIFVADPGAGFPPGAPGPTTISRSGMLHFVSGGLGFYALIAASFVFARRFAALGRRGWTTFSLVTGLGFFLAFAAIASGPPSAPVMLAFYAAIVWVWIWLSALFASLLRNRPAVG